ncbi:MAG: AAA family ATPase, partial [Bacteroidota bacterium]|nr:AAA family ATPase [Bacteroidota bacterium]
MIPVKLTIQGLYSYQEKQTIDFTKLTEANLFGIFGAVGSGKSSILEAITFAIYGETDRLNSRDNRNYNMMNLKSSDLLIEFIFETGKDQTAYQAVVKGRRNGKKFEEVKALERTAYRKENENWIPIEPEMLEKAIGLSYNNFKRTIIIPQGQFQEFLQLGSTDRTRMMKELFNLERFELYYKVVSLESKNNANKQNIEGQLQQLGAIDPEQVKQFEEQLAQIKTEIGQLSLILKENQVKESEFKMLQELIKKLADAQQKLKQLQDQEPKYIQQETLIRNYEQCLIQFKGLMDALALSNKKIIQNTGQIEKETIILKKSEEEIATLEIAFTELKIAYDGRDILKLQADELGKITRLNILSASVLSDEDRIKKGMLILDKTIETSAKLKLEKAKLELLLKAEKLRLPDLAMLSEVKSWHVDNKNLNQQFAEKKLEAEKFKKEIEAIDEAARTKFKDPIFAGLAPDATTVTGIQIMKEKIELLKKQILELDGEADHYRVQAKLEEYAVNLHDGEACPLCGSLQHPTVLSAESVAEALSKALKNRGEIEKTISNANENISQLSDLANRMKFNSEHLDGLTAKLKELEVKIADHIALFRWEGFKDEVTVSQAFLAAESIQKILNEKEKELEKTIANLEKEAS